MAIFSWIVLRSETGLNLPSKICAECPDARAFPLMIPLSLTTATGLFGNLSILISKAIVWCHVRYEPGMRYFVNSIYNILLEYQH